MFIWILFCALIVVDTKGEEEVLSPIVTLQNGGQIQGHQLISQKNNKYWSFQQIPYAAPPIGDLRFKEAIEPEVWCGVLKTTQNTKICVQLKRNSSKETEDCLYLNVYTPADLTTAQSPLPVYVFFHGGLFVKQDGTFESYGPKYIIDYGIILVTLNYRLGAFGFLSTGDSVISGNLGLKDQNLALKWVQKNIQRFGGDPTKVTIGGQSAGAGCVGHHILSERSKGLFRGAIQESGSPICSKMFSKNPKYYALQLAKKLDKKLDDNSSSQKLLEVLQAASAEDIKKYSDLVVPDSLRNSVGNEGNTVWNPVEEFTEFGFVKGPMHDNFKKGKFNRVSVLIGFNSEEEVSFDLNELKTKALYFDSNAAFLINGNLNIKEANKVTAGTQLKKIYTSGRFALNFPAFVKFISDAKYTNGICRQAELQSYFSDVFLYQFSYNGALGGVASTIPGVGHNEELNYIYENDFNRNIQKISNSDQKVQSAILELGSNFIKYLDPKTKVTSWPKVKNGVLNYLNIDANPNVESTPRNFNKVKQIYTQYADEFQYTY